MSATDNSGWQPIETAPRDGTWVLLLRRYSREIIFRAWSKSAKNWVTDWGDWQTADANVTHWHPLPALPTPPEEARAA